MAEVIDGTESNKKDEVIQETSPEAGKDKPDRKKWIPREDFDRLSQTVEQLTSTIKEMAKQPPKVEAKEEKVLTRSDLRVAVEKGQITQEEADSLWDKQLLEQARKAARETALHEVTTKESITRVDADLRRYRDVIPNAWKEGTEERAKVAEMFNYLVSIGQPETRETELAAMVAAFGPPDKIGKSRSTRVVEHDEQSGGGGENDSGKKDVVKTLSDREKDYYSDQIKKGRYKDWKEVTAELERYGNPSLRRKMGARV